MFFVMFDDFYVFYFENVFWVVPGEFCAPHGAERDAQNRNSLMKSGFPRWCRVWAPRNAAYRPQGPPKGPQGPQ